MASLESLGGGGLVFGPPGMNEDEEEEEDQSVVSSGVTLSNRVVDSRNSQIHTPVFVYHQVLLSVLAQQGQVGLCFYDSKDSSLHYMMDTPDNYELHLLARGKHYTACCTVSNPK